jgi:uncharacterized lipoprotein YmbA
MKQFLSVILLLLLCSSCVQLGSDSQPLRYYLLQPNAVAQKLPRQTNINVTLQTIHVPAYLDRLQLTSYNQRQQVIIASLDRWAEPLDENLNRVLKENLSRHLQGGRITSQTKQETAAETLKLQLTINSFDGILGEHVSVDIRWMIIRNGVSEQIKQGRFTDNTPIGNSYAELVQGLNRALDNFSYKLAEELVSRF